MRTHLCKCSSRNAENTETWNGWFAISCHILAGKMKIKWTRRMHRMILGHYATVKYHLKQFVATAVKNQSWLVTELEKRLLLITRLKKGNSLIVSYSLLYAWLQISTYMNWRKCEKKTLTFNLRCIGNRSRTKKYYFAFYRWFLL